MEMQDSSLPTKLYTHHHQRTLYLPTSPPRNKAANKLYMHRAYHRQRHPAIPSNAAISFTTTAPYFSAVIIHACNCVTMTDNPRMAAANSTSTRQSRTLPNSEAAMPPPHRCHCQHYHHRCNHLSKPEPKQRTPPHPLPTRLQLREEQQLWVDVWQRRISSINHSRHLFTRVGAV